MTDDGEPEDDFEREFLELEEHEQEALSKWGTLGVDTFRRLHIGATGLACLIADVLHAHQAVEAGLIDAQTALQDLADETVQTYGPAMFESSPPAERAATEAKAVLSLAKHKASKPG